MINQDEEIPYLNRSAFDLAQVTEDTGYSKDEEEQSTLRRVRKILSEGLRGIDAWHAFSDGHRALSELKLKQDIHAHQLASDILTPALEAVDSALAIVDEKFRQRNNK
jgi:hypothetical protein